MKSKLGIVLLLFVLNFDGLAREPVGAGLVPARSAFVIARIDLSTYGHGTEPLPLQINSPVEFLFAPLSRDGVAVSNSQRRKKRRRSGRQRRAESIPVIPPSADVPVIAPAPPPPIGEAPNTAPAAAPPVQASPDMGTPGGGASKKRSSAPKIKPPTVQIKPPTR
ncbi:MAG TPA: hypothetical protein VGN95_12195 [Pyrinomonadaceae bacterium]|nr:hypothetical protein [Pyrinomonadaceae bacterium]